MSDAAMDAVIDTVSTETPEFPMSLFFMQILGGKLKESTAPIGFSDVAFEWVAQYGWADPSLNEKGPAQVASLKAKMKAYNGKEEAYVNFTDCSAEAVTPEDPSMRVGGPANLERIREVKMRVDPTNMFCSNPFKKLLNVEGEAGAGLAAE